MSGLAVPIVGRPYTRGLASRASRLRTVTEQQLAHAAGSA